MKIGFDLATIESDSQGRFIVRNDEDVKKLKDKGIDAADYSDAVIAYAIQSVMRGNSNMFGQLLKLMGEGSERIELQNLNDDSAAALDELFKENERKFNQSDQS